MGCFFFWLFRPVGPHDGSPLSRQNRSRSLQGTLLNGKFIGDLLHGLLFVDMVSSMPSHQAVGGPSERRDPVGSPSPSEGKVWDMVAFCTNLKTLINFVITSETSIRFLHGRLMYVLFAAPGSPKIMDSSTGKTPFLRSSRTGTFHVRKNGLSCA